MTRIAVRRALQASSRFYSTAPRWVPRAQQSEAIAQTMRHFDEGFGRANVIMTPGSGKTGVGLGAIWHMYSENGAGNCMAVFSSLTLLDQWVATYRRSFDTDDVSVLVVASECADHDLSCTMNTPDIEAFLTRGGFEKHLILSTYHSLPKVGKAVRSTVQNLDITVFDEAHRMATPNVDGLFTYGLCDRNLPCTHRLFMTATRRVNGGVNSMHKKEQYGETVYELPKKEADRAGITVPLKSLMVQPGDAYVQACNKFPQPEVAMADVVASGVSLEDAQLACAILLAHQQHGVKKLITFHKTIAIAKTFAQNLGKVLGALGHDVTALHINGSERAEGVEALARFQDSKGLTVMTNAKVLEEGFDLQDVDCVVLANNVQSNRRMIQMAGRASRVSTGKEFGYVMVPWNWTLDSNGELTLDIYSQAALVHMWEYYCEHNSQMQPQLHLERETDNLGNFDFLGKSGNSRSDFAAFVDQIVCVGGEESIARGIRDRMHPAFIKEHLELLIYSKQTDPFYPQLAALGTYRQKHGHCDVVANLPKDHPDHELSKFVRECRRLNKIGRLSNERKEALLEQQMNFKPRKEQIEENFSRKVEMYARYRAENNDAVHVPTDYLTACGTQLGHWYGTQRGLFISGRMVAFKGAALSETIGAPLDHVWSTPDVELRWKNDCALFAAFYQKMSRNPPKTVQSGKRKIGLWTSRMRKKAREGNVENWKLAALADVVGDVDSWAKVQGPQPFSDAEKEQMLNDGYSFTQEYNANREATRVAREENFSRKVEMYARYRAENNDAVHVPRDYLTPCGTQLGHWYGTQKGLFLSGTLKPFKEAALSETIGAPLDHVWSGAIHWSTLDQAK